MTMMTMSMCHINPHDMSESPDNVTGQRKQSESLKWLGNLPFEIVNIVVILIQCLYGSWFLTILHFSLDSWHPEIHSKMKPFPPQPAVSTDKWNLTSQVTGHPPPKLNGWLVIILIEFKLSKGPWNQSLNQWWYLPTVLIISQMSSLHWLHWCAMTPMTDIIFRT